MPPVDAVADREHRAPAYGIRYGAQGRLAARVARVGHPLALGLVIAVLSAVFAWLADARGVWSFTKVFVASAALLLTLMGLGAVFGKTLGDFLRNVNG